MRLCKNTPWHYLPILLGVTSLFGMISTYVMAKQNCHVEKWILPYISYTGTEHPESSVFGLLLNTEGFLGIVVVVLAWRFMQQVDQKGYLNTATLIAGVMSCFGVIMVGNFQVSKLKAPHYVGAGLAFIIGTIYCVMSSILTLGLHRQVKLRPTCSMFVCILRFTASSLMLLSIVVLSILGVLRLNYEDQSTNVTKSHQANVTAPPKIEGGLTFTFPNGSCIPLIENVPHYKRFLELAGSVTEWLLTACLLFTLSLYAYEFKHICNVKVILKSKTKEILCSKVLEKKTSKLSNRLDTSDCSTFPNAERPLLLRKCCDNTALSHSESLGNGIPSNMIVSKNNNKELCTTATDKTELDLAKTLPSSEQDNLRQL